MDDVRDTRSRIVSEADVWCVRLRESDCTEAERRKFERWRQASPEHSQAYAQAERLWAQLAMAVEDPALQAMPEARLPPRRLYPTARPAWFRFGWAAAALVCIAVAGHVLLSEPVPAGRRYATAVGETRPVTLEDGSVVTLDAGSGMEVRYGKERRVALERGTAFFEVVSDPSRPFVVVAGEGRATVLGTRFQVRIASDQPEVVLQEGAVRLDLADGGAGQGVVLAPGQKAMLGDARTWQAEAADVEVLTAWRQGRLIFRDVPLADALAQMARYHPEEMRLEDPGLATLLVNGVFRAGDMASFALALESTLPVRVIETEQGRRIVRAGTGRATMPRTVR